MAYLLPLFLLLILVVNRFQQHRACRLTFLGVPEDHDGGHLHVCAVDVSHQRCNLPRQPDLSSRAKLPLQLFGLLLDLPNQSTLLRAE